jgi:hypothetical protein
MAIFLMENTIYTCDDAKGIHVKQILLNIFTTEATVKLSLGIT